MTWLHPVKPDRFHDGHRLPLRLEIQIDELEAPFAVIVDADHLDVDYSGETFDDMLELVERANSVLPHSIADRLSIMSPCDRMPWKIATAFECLSTGAFTHWITPEIVAQLLVENVWCSPNGQPSLSHYRRWREWRRIEDQKIAELGIRASPSSPSKAPCKPPKPHLSVVR